LAGFDGDQCGSRDPCQRRQLTLSQQHPLAPRRRVSFIGRPEQYRNLTF
jgi:hypothetical protein